MAGEIQLNSTTFATESGGTITVANVDSATNRQNLGLEIGVDVQQFDSETTKNDVANTFTANQIISVTDNTNAALSVTQLGTGNALIVNDEGSDTTPFVIDASGNCGIGTSVAGRKFHVYGTGTATKVEGSGGSVYVQLACNSQTNSESGYIGYTSAQALSLWTAETERMRIDSSGNVLVGTNTTSPTNGGHVIFSGSVGRTTTDHASGTGSGNGYAAFKYGGTTIGSITQSGTTAVAYNTSSDYRLKENITEITDGITRVKQLNPSRFNFIADPNRIVDGFIAHEVSNVVPEAISGEKDAVDDDGNPEYQGIDQSKLAPLLTAALQESIALIESQQSQIDALTARIEALETA